MTLSNETPNQLQQQAANLLWHLNELALTTSDCEDVIGQYLVAEDEVCHKVYNK